MLDHLILNKLKWWNVNSDNANIDGKNYLAIPTSFTICKGAELSGWGNYQSNFYALEDTQVTCTGRGSGGYFFAGSINGNVYPDGSGVTENMRFGLLDASGQVPGFVRSADVKNVKWGGSHPLKHLYQAFRAITRKVVPL